MKRRIRLLSLMILIVMIAVGLTIYRAWMLERSVVYVQGDVKSPGKQKVLGPLTVMDALMAAGSLSSTADPMKIRLVRPAPSGTVGSNRVLRVDLDGILRRGDLSTNYPLMPGDRLVVYRDPQKSSRQAPAAALRNDLSPAEN